MIGSAVLAQVAWGTSVDAGKPSAELQALRTRLEARAEDGRWHAGAEQSLVTEIEDVVRRFRSGEGPRNLAVPVRRLIEDAHQRHAGWIKERQVAIMAADGDLEAAQQAPEWQEREALALRTLYHLDWVYLEAATRYERSSSKRSDWLRVAADGFGQFTIETNDSELASESLYGRGLCHRELARLPDAATDFKQALDLRPSEQLAAKILAALVETEIAADRLSEALQWSATFRERARNPESEFLRAKVLLLALATPETDASRRAGFRREAIDLVGRLERRGGNWAALARQLVAAGIAAPDDWLRERTNATFQWVLAEALRGQGRCEEALPLYEGVAGSEKPPRAGVLLALGLCEFQLGRYAAASTTFERILALDGDEQMSGDAAYLRFKAVELLHRSEGTEENRARLGNAALEYVTRFPSHAHTFEARFRLGEIERVRGNLLAAAGQFDAVTGEMSFELQAIFQAAQCYVEQWENQLEGDRTAGDDKLAAAALGRLEKFLERSADFRARRGARPSDEAVLLPMEARARVLGALLLTRRRGREDLLKALAWLERYAEDFPAETGLQAEADAVRAVALLGLGRFLEARGALQSFLARHHGSARDYRLLRRLGVQCLELADEQERAGASRETAELRTAALAIYEELLSAIDGGDGKDSPAEGLRQLIATLRQQTR